MPLRSYKYLLVGANGQIGRYLIQELMGRGSTVVVLRKPVPWMTGSVTGIDSIIGDMNTVELPEAQHIINAAGHTILADGEYKHYWETNIMGPVRLANHAFKTGATLHQLSSVAVAEFRDGPLAEKMVPIPDERQLRYSTSKVLMELALRATKADVRIYRIGDVVPPVRDMDVNWRPTHWLPILFSCGKPGFDYAPPSYGVWLSRTDELARNMVDLLESGCQCYHLLGKEYTWETFRRYATDEGVRPAVMGEWMTKIILHGPEAKDVTHAYTPLQQWTELDAAYWQAFAQRSLRKGK